MQPGYLARLPLDIRSLVDHVERTSRIEVIVEVDSTRERNIPNQQNTMACHFTPHGAKLLIPTQDYFPDGSVLHELLHIRRFLVDGIPCLIDSDAYEYWSPDHAAGLTRLDNSIEHLLIVPEELQLRPDRGPYWEGVMMRLYDGLTTEGISDVDRQQLALINWVFIKHVLPNTAVRSYAKSVLDEFHLADQAEHYYDELIPILSDKENVVKVSFRHLGLPLEMASLEYIDTQTGTQKEVSLV